MRHNHKVLLASRETISSCTWRSYYGMKSIMRLFFLPILPILVSQNNNQLWIAIHPFWSNKTVNKLASTWSKCKSLISAKHIQGNRSLIKHKVCSWIFESLIALNDKSELIVAAKDPSKFLHRELEVLRPTTCKSCSIQLGCFQFSV